jgi:hypothetical protein
MDSLAYQQVLCRLPSSVSHCAAVCCVQICEVLRADGLVYQDVDDLLAVGKALNPNIKTFDAACFDGHYVTGAHAQTAELPGTDVQSALKTLSCPLLDGCRCSTAVYHRASSPCACLLVTPRTCEVLSLNLTVACCAVLCCVPVLRAGACACVGDVDDEYLAELELGRGAKRTRSGRKTSLVAVAR